MDEKKIQNLIDKRVTEILKDRLNENNRMIKRIVDDAIMDFKKKNLSFRSKLSVDTPLGAFDIANNGTVTGSGFLPVAGGTITGNLRINGNVGFYNTGATAKQTVTGSRGANAALASLLSALATIGLLTDSSS